MKEDFTRVYSGNNCAIVNMIESSEDFKYGVEEKSVPTIHSYFSIRREMYDIQQQAYPPNFDPLISRINFTELIEYLQRKAEVSDKILIINDNIVQIKNANIFLHSNNRETIFTKRFISNKAPFSILFNRSSEYADIQIANINNTLSITFESYFDADFVKYSLIETFDMDFFDKLSDEIKTNKFITQGE